MLFDYCFVIIILAVNTGLASKVFQGLDAKNLASVWKSSLLLRSQGLKIGGQGPEGFPLPPLYRLPYMDMSSNIKGSPMSAGVIITVVLIEVVLETHQSFPHHNHILMFSHCSFIDNFILEQPRLHQTSPEEVTSQLNEASQTQITLDVATPPSTRITILTIVNEIPLRSPPNLSHITRVC